MEYTDIWNNFNSRNLEKLCDLARHRSLIMMIENVENLQEYSLYIALIYTFMILIVHAFDYVKNNNRFTFHVLK